jgi:flagellar hook protein FlgE
MFAAVSGLRTHQNRMDVISNNIANVNTYGFKAGRATFKESIYQNMYGSSEGNDVMGGQNPSQVGYGSQIGSISVNHAPGNYEPTGFGTDCMINGNGYFLVGPKNVAGEGIEEISNEDTEDNAVSKLQLTRVGAFTVDGDGYLVDENRNVVYGFYNTGGPAPVAGTTPFTANTTVLKPIRITDIDGTLGDGESPMNLSQIAIDANGLLSGTGEDGAIYKVAQLGICNVPNPNALEKIGDSYYQIRNNTGFCQAFPAGQGTTGSLITGGLEMSTTNLATEISNMIITQRGFQANSKMITVSDEMLQELISMKR